MTDRRMPMWTRRARLKQAIIRCLYRLVPWAGWYVHHRRHHNCTRGEAYRWARWNVRNARLIHALGGNVGDGLATTLRKAGACD